MRSIESSSGVRRILLARLKLSETPLNQVRIYRRAVGNCREQNVRVFSVWVLELVKLVVRRRLYPLNAECPICHQMVRLHYNKAGRRHLFAHARALYEGSRYGVHYHAKVKCAGSGARTAFNPHPQEMQRFRLPNNVFDE
jgi:hypothetical protein